MFVEARSPLPMTVDVAETALGQALAGDGLIRSSDAAYREGLTALRSVGPRGLSKRVLVRTLPARRTATSIVVRIRWEATGLGGQLFPALDADLALTAVNDVTSVMSIVGRYAPPFGGLGRALDRTLLAGAAQATVDAFVRELSHSIQQIAATGRATPRTVGATG
jgi:hypothetical protein